jgi:hypothetical protein
MTKLPEQANELLEPKDAAPVVHKTKQTLAIWRCTKKVRLPYLKVGGRILYRRQDLIAFLESSRVEPSEAR